MGLLAPPAPGSLLKTGGVKPADPIKKNVSGEKPTAKKNDEKSSQDIELAKKD